MESVNWNLLAIIIAALGIIFTAMNFFHSHITRKETLENKVKTAFLKKKIWTNEGVINGGDSIFFDLSIDRPLDHIFAGHIKYSNSVSETHQLVFYFEKINRKSITLRLRKTEGYREFGSAKAKLKFLNPDLFQITFSKGYGFRKNRFMPNLPRKTEIFPNEVSSSVETISQNNSTTEVLTNDIIEKLSPERNYAKVKEILGLPDKVIKDSSVFEDDIPYSMFSKVELENIISDIYFLKNATLKVTTIDRQSIHSITVFGYDSRLEIPETFYPCDMYNNAIGEARICQEIIDMASIQSVRTIRESSTALRVYMGPPFYKHITYFVDGHLDDEEVPNYSDLIGSKITGFCLSDSSMVFYIYDYELR